MVFNAESAHRRKSSLVQADTPAQLDQIRKGTACFVHSLLDEQRRQGQFHSGLNGIAEMTTAEPHEQRELAEPKSLDQSPGLKAKLQRETYGDHTPGTHTPGQPDEMMWKERQSGPPPGPEGQPAAVALEPAIHSRLLTKRQLSDMAWGVRELSKRLGSVNLKLKVKTVFILTKAHDEMLIQNTRDVAKWLLSNDRQVQYVVYVEDKLRDNKKFDADSLLEELSIGADKGDLADGDVNGNQGRQHKRLRYWTEDMCRSRPHTFDFIITLGGDGTVLYASWLFQRIVPPVLSFALGSLGFMTKFNFENFEQTLTTAFRDGIQVSLRLRFEGTVMRSQKRKRKTIRSEFLGITHVIAIDEDEGPEESCKRDLVEELVGEEKDDERTHRPDGTYEILNDVVVDRGPNPSKPP